MLVEEAEGEEARERSDREPAVLPSVPHGLEVVETPTELARAVVRGEEETRLAVDRIGVLGETLEPRRGASILPREDGRERRTGRAIPADDARALRRESGRGDLACASEFLRASSRRCPQRPDELLGILLDAVVTEALLGDAHRGARDDLAAHVEGDRARGAPALVESEEQRTGYSFAHGSRLAADSLRLLSSESAPLPPACDRRRVRRVAA